ncbi:MAG: hypothetical protein Fues2KO_25000 [Fuerstiella sp.]
MNIRNARIRNPVFLLAVLCATSAFAQSGATPETANEPTSNVDLPSVWNLAVQGGWFMIPIAVASVISLTFTLERIVGLRRSRVLPRSVLRSLKELLASGSVEPRALWQCCEGSRAPLARIIRAAVLKTGRPQSEVEAAVVDAVGRETTELTRNLRPINVVASIAPLLGLLGTVQGMIMAFMVTSTTTSTGTAKAQELAQGIYTALVTTFAGLCVAVVSVVLANYLEGKIQRLLKGLEGIFLSLLPRLEPWEGRIRVQETTDGSGQIRILKHSNVVGRTPTATDQTRPPGSARRLPRRSSKPDGNNTSGQQPATVAAGNRASREQDLAAAASSEAHTLRSTFDR